MKRNSSISLGPGAPSLILILVVLTMSVLGMLSLMAAHSDLNLSARSAEVIQAVYELQEQAERTRAEIAGAVVQDPDGKGILLENPDAIPEGAELEEAQISWQETDGVRTIDCAVILEQTADGIRVPWVRHTLTTVIDGETGEEIWN